MQKVKAKTRKRYLTDAKLNKMKLWQLLTIGLRDLKKQEITKDCYVEMQTWLTSNSHCTACLAGSVVRHSIRNWRSRLDANLELAVVPAWMSALDSLRTGSLCAALFVLNRKDEDCLCVHIGSYDGPNGEWWKQMRKFRKQLKEKNI
jgi:hypothetical protein